ncbi:nodulation protein NoeA-related protein [Candidatus Moduliflexus flocculans]|uniref:Nodulation protein NoeA-related protein n=1 Tax=Candidatus Moduliflexus flocculans TaxID=1499966 RepID=A0A0S6VT08_9BACT|nr:nodulation protein NoeA-related protein [Candidatus Moduliflexus flocculans]
MPQRDSSFRDPSGFVFQRNRTLYRQINRSYREEYDALMSSLLYEELVASKRLIPHIETRLEPEDPAVAYKVIQPVAIPFISYPYEWAFSQLKHAALLTLNIQQTAMKYGMSLKDASAYNIQFYQGQPIFIDTLSFERYREGEPWVAYRQFCQHFLAPLALMAYTDIRLSQLLRVYIDGIPLDLARKLLPRRTLFRFSLLLHLHLHAASFSHFAKKTETVSTRSVMSRQAMLGLIDSLASGIRGLRWRPAGTEWAEYYHDTNYSTGAFQQKHEFVAACLDELQPANVWDIGANTGEFSRLASARQIPTVAFDSDPAAVEQAYLTARKSGDTYLLPLLLDLTNPSPAQGWHHQERQSLQDRAPADLAFALALIHHLAIGNNVPFRQIARFFSAICRALIIEFVPKTDSQVQRLLITRKDVFDDYTQEAFERAFQERFHIKHSIQMQESERRLYLITVR